MTTKGSLARGVACAIAALLATSAPLANEPAQATADGLKARFEQLRNSRKTPFDIPLYIESKQTDNTLAGDVHSRIDKPFDTVKAELSHPRAWCEILILHPNVKGCTVDAGDKSLAVRLGSGETPAKFDYRVAQSGNDYLDVRLGAKEGPMGTSDYNFRIEVAPLDAKSSVLHLAYSHAYGARARFALQTYFNTLGRGKVGFTVVDRTPDGKPVYVGDLRGGMERNAMRYYLAIQAHLDALSAPPPQRLERGMRTWLAQTERYPLQLKEEDGFVERKRAEIQRFQRENVASAARPAG
jgi:hypothetical protein